MKHDRNPTFLYPNLDEGSNLSKEGSWCVNVNSITPMHMYWDWIVSMDANFGLPTKKAAGQSILAMVTFSFTTKQSLRKKRSEEEIELLEIEMKRVLEFLLQKDHLRCVCAELVQNTNQFSHGAHNVLSNMNFQVSHAIAVANKAFNTSLFHNNIVSEGSECEEDIDSNSDTDDDMYSVV